MLAIAASVVSRAKSLKIFTAFEQAKAPYTRNSAVWTGLAMRRLWSSLMAESFLLPVTARAAVRLQRRLGHIPSPTAKDGEVTPMAHNRYRGQCRQPARPVTRGDAHEDTCTGLKISWNGRLRYHRRLHRRSGLMKKRGQENSTS